MTQEYIHCFKYAESKEQVLSPRSFYADYTIGAPTTEIREQFSHKKLIYNNMTSVC